MNAAPEREKVSAFTKKQIWETKMNGASIFIHESAKEAPQWSEQRRVDSLTVSEFHIVRNGTEEGRSTVDIVLTDADGIKYVGMITGRLFCAVAQAIGNEA